MPKLRIMHYINQFFVGIGGEDKAETPFGYRDGSIGPGKLLQSLLGDSADIVVTAYCGDDYFPLNQEEVAESISRLAHDFKIDLMVAGPAFSSGRHGLACSENCLSVAKSLEIPCLTAMQPDNPGAERYKEFKNKDVYLKPTSGSVTGMKDAMGDLSKSILKIAAGSSLGTPSEEGYLPRGIRSLEFVEDTSANRAINMLLKKINGESFISEIPIEKFETAEVAPYLKNIDTVRLALVTTAGIVPSGNPDGFKYYRNKNWRKYPLHNVNDMRDGEWESVHGGYNTVFIENNPNFAVPLDVCRKMEKEGVFAELYPHFYGTTGVLALIPDVERIGSEIADDMIKQQVDAALIVST